MGVSPKDIAWGSYKTYEGPFFRGSIKYSMPDMVDESHRRLRVLTATEGGAYDAINMYDRCIVSVGLIQWCEARYYLVSKLLHAVAEQVGPEAVIGPLGPALDLCCAEFRKNKNGHWRFHWKDSRGEANTLEKQQQLFLGCDGLKGSWSATAKMRARLWAACMANIWQDPRAREVQAQYTADRMTAFLMRESRAILWDKNVGDEGWSGMIRAAYFSYAGNLPAIANKHLQIAVGTLKSPKWSPAWCIGVLRELTFGPGIKIYPHRYEAIRPWLERLWDGVELPKTAEDLRAWREPALDEQEPLPPEPVPPSPPETVKEETRDVTLPSMPVVPVPDEVEASDNEKDEVREAVMEEETAIVLREEAPVTELPKNTQTPEGVLGWILHILGLIMNFFLRRNKDE